MSSNQDIESIVLNLNIVGGGVGKTHLTRRFFHNEFKENERATIAATIADEHNITSNEKRYCIRVWDFPGLECLHYNLAPFYRNANAALLCYDASELETFHSLKTCLARFREHNKSCPIYVCATRRDLLSKAAQFELLEHYARESCNLGEKFFLTSSKTGENVYEMFMDIFTDMVCRAPSPHEIECQKNLKKPFCTIN